VIVGGVIAGIVNEQMKSPNADEKSKQGPCLSITVSNYFLGLD
jgi:hypothetical protein